MYLFKKDTILKLCNCLEKFHKNNEKLPLELQIEVTKQLKICEIIVKLVNLIYLASAVFLIAFPFILMKLMNEKNMLMFGFVLPGIDYKSSPAYEINFVFQLMQIYVICVGVNASDAFYAWFLLHARMQIHVIIGQLKKLDNFIAESGSTLEQNRIVDEIIEKHVLLTW